MTVTELIEELKRLPPHLPVRVMPESITLRDEHGEGDVPLWPALDATEVDFVRYEGSYVLVQGK